MQRSEMKKILGKFEMHFLQISVYFFKEFVRSLRLVVSFFAMEKRKKKKYVFLPKKSEFRIYFLIIRS
jgi:hypothetical protein